VNGVSAGPWGPGDPRALSVRVAMLHRAVLRSEERARRTGETNAGLFHAAALLDELAAAQEAGWRSLAAG
jgi:hypothetical protein